MTSQIKDPGAATRLRPHSHGDAHAEKIRALLAQMRPAPDPVPVQADEEVWAWPTR